MKKLPSSPSNILRVYRTASYVIFFGFAVAKAQGSMVAQYGVWPEDTLSTMSHTTTKCGQIEEKKGLALWVSRNRGLPTLGFLGMARIMLGDLGGSLAGVLRQLEKEVDGMA